MSVGQAKKFIQRGLRDSTLREDLNASSNQTALLAVLKREDLVFSAHEFDEAFHNLLVQCQEKEQADQLNEFKTWWNLTVALSQHCGAEGKNGKR